MTKILMISNDFYSIFLWQQFWQSLMTNLTIPTFQNEFFLSQKMTQTPRVKVASRLATDNV